mgnify:CR=1 FL=1
MRHNIWKKYIKILCSWILILSICFLSLNVVVEASGTDMEMKGYTDVTDFTTAILEEVGDKR